MFAVWAGGHETAFKLLLLGDLDGPCGRSHPPAVPARCLDRDPTREAEAGRYLAFNVLAARAKSFGLTHRIIP